MIDIDDERFWDIIFDEACVEGNKAERIKNELENIVAFDTEKVVEELEEKTDFLKDCTKYGNKDSEQQEKSYSTMMMYEIADLVEDLIDIVKKGGGGMREILFKAKRIDNGKWIEGYYFYNPNIDKHFVHNWLSGGLVEVDTDTICQYTGLTDKNGNKIWENDVVRFARNFSKYRWSEGHNFEVYFNEFLCHFALDDGYGKNGQYDRFNLTGAKAKDIEVIGNIFDNADLLKGE